MITLLHRLPNRLIIWRTIGLAIAVGALASQAVAQRPVFTIDRKPYTLEALCGSSEKQLRDTFDAEVKTFSDADIRRLLANDIRVINDPALVEKAPRRDLEGLLWTYNYHCLLDQASTRLVLAHICSRIVHEHRIKLDDYFDPRPLRDANGRYLRFMDYLFDHRADDPGLYEQQYGDAVKAFRVKMPQAGWVNLRGIVRHRPKYMRWVVSLRQGSGQFDEYGLRAAYAHHLVAEACKTGVYRDMAAAHLAFLDSTVRVVEISNYSGGRKSLESYLAGCIDATGHAAPAGFRHFEETLRTVNTRVSVSQRVVLGGQVANGLDVPVLGRVYEIKPNVYRVITWEDKKDHPVSQSNLAVALKVFAFKVAAGRYLPQAESHVPGWTFDVKLAADELSGDPALTMPEIEVAPYVLKPYPATAFAEFERHRPRLDELAAAIATMTAQGDKKGAQAVIDQTSKEMSDVKTEAVRLTYESLADLAKKQLERPDN